MAKGNVIISDGDGYLRIYNPYSTSFDYTIQKVNIVGIAKAVVPTSPNLSGIDKREYVVITTNDGRKPLKIPYLEIGTPTSTSFANFLAWLRGIAFSLPNTQGTFTNADLVANVLTISLVPSMARPAVVSIIDPDGTSEIVSFVDNDDGTVRVDFGAAIGAGTFTYYVLHR